ncbi:potassium channel AKT2/3 [Cucumis melo var. makuwa]|uniref:Potassium channel AKT2/3 n=1 Tax=Cucumis melo var. makuwa TaxID=1194695 RepID=A0A5A7TBP5_CUCMM|nr:potassium channel AKT2/3 [Cucumis melo var. makuwa]
MVVLVAYSVWVYPLEVAFLDAIPRRKLLIVDSIVDIFFAIDIVFTFFVAYIDHRTQLLVRDSKKIAIRYLSTWFLMDLASTIPFDTLAYLSTGKYDLCLPFALLGLLRFWRLRRVKQFFTSRPSTFWLSVSFLLLVHPSTSVFAVHQFVFAVHSLSFLSSLSLPFVSLFSAINFLIFSLDVLNQLPT